MTAEGLGDVTRGSGPDASLDDLVYGAPPFRAQVAAGEIKAVTLESRKRAVAERFGPDGVAKVRAALSGEALRMWDVPILASSWISAAPYLDIERAIIRELCDDDLDRMVALVTQIAESELHLIYRFLLKLGSPGFLIKRIGVAFESKVRPGKMRLVESSERSGISEITGVVLPPYVCGRTAPAWAARALELAGARNVETVHSACRHQGDDACRYETRWG